MRDRRAHSPLSAPDPEAAAEAAALARALGQVEALQKTGRVREALAACQPLAARYPREWRVLGVLGMLYAGVGDIHQALLRLTDALAVAPANPVELMTDLARVYTQAGAPMHALKTWRSIQRTYGRMARPADLPDPDPFIAALAAEVHGLPGLEGLDAGRAEEALLAAERGQLRLLAHTPLEKVETECRAALRLAPNYRAPYLTWSRALFFDGQVGAAIRLLEGLVQTGGAPPDIGAALAFYRYWGGAPVEECRALLVRAEGGLPAAPAGATVALAQVWGLLGDDAAVLRLLNADCGLPTAETEASPPVAGAARCVQLVATARANQGQVEAARDLLYPFHGTPDARLQCLIGALEHGAPLPGAGERYPYVAWDEVVPAATFRRFLTPPPARPWPFGRWIGGPQPAGPLRERLLAVYPRLAEVGALMLWAGDPGVEQLGIRLLKLLGTPPARSLLEAHLRGRTGSYAGRQDAGYALVDLIALPNGTLVPFWSGTDWGEIRLYRLTPGGIYPARQQAEFAAQLEIVERRAAGGGG